MSKYIEPATASAFRIYQGITCVNPSNPEDKIQFDSLEEMNARIFEMRDTIEALRSEMEGLRHKAEEEIGRQVEQRQHWEDEAKSQRE
jgi:uncharacterized protein with von Willebrand factor type A (vWA) domain